jgi:hypothetical protein
VSNRYCSNKHTHSVTVGEEPERERERALLGPGTIHNGDSASPRHGLLPSHTHSEEGGGGRRRRERERELYQELSITGGLGGA